MIDETLLPRMRALGEAMGQGMSVFDPPVSEAAVAEFERRNGVTLPDDYRWFVTHVASGGPGPANGLISFRAGLTDDRMNQPWIDPVRWNETDGDYDDGDVGGVYQGVIAVADIGCGSLWLLVIEGTRRGEIWGDFTAGSEPYVLGGTSFVPWYGEWVDKRRAELAALPEVESEALREVMAAADANPDSQDALLFALHRVGPTADRANFSRYLERAAELSSVSHHSAPSIIDYALDLSLGETAERLLDVALADCESGEMTFRCLRALVRAERGRFDDALHDWALAQAAPDFDPPKRCAARIAVKLLKAGDIARAMTVYFDEDGFVAGSASEVVEEALGDGEPELAVQWTERFIERVNELAQKPDEPADADPEDEDEQEHQDESDDDGWEDEWDDDDDDDDDEYTAMLVDAHASVCRPLFQLGRASEAEAHADTAAELGGWVDWARLALAACEGRAFALSLEYLDRCTARPWWIANLRGCCLNGLDRLDEALEAFEESLQARNWIVPFENRAYTLTRMGRADEARKLLDEVEQFAPEFAWTYYHRAALLAREGASDEARAALDHALQLGLDPSLPETEPYLAVL